MVSFGKTTRKKVRWSSSSGGDIWACRAARNMVGMPAPRFSAGPRSSSVLSCKFVENGLALRAAPGYGFGRRCHHAPAEAPDPDRRRAVEARGVGPPAEVGPATRPAVEDRPGR